MSWSNYAARVEVIHCKLVHLPFVCCLYVTHAIFLLHLLLCKELQFVVPNALRIGTMKVGNNQKVLMWSSDLQNTNQITNPEVEFQIQDNLIRILGVMTIKSASFDYSLLLTVCNDVFLGCCYRHQTNHQWFQQNQQTSTCNHL